MARMTGMRVLFSIALACTALPQLVRGAANIDVGFAQDGVTTYCQGVRGVMKNPLQFEELELHNAGRCPIEVKLDIKTTTVGQQMPLEVSWAASARTGEVPGNIFPRAIDQTTKKPQNVIASLLRACKAGTNCAADGVVVPQLVGAPTNEVGPFDAQNRKALPVYRFLFPSLGHYVIVAIVVLPGDSALNVSASQFIAFQRITVVDGVGPATVSPPMQPAGVNASAAAAEIGAEGKTDNINFQTDLVKSAVAVSSVPSASQAPSPASNRGSSGVDASFSGNTKSGQSQTSNGSSGSQMNMMLIGGALAVVAIGAIVFFVVTRKKNTTMKNKDPTKPLDPSSEAGIFRLTVTGNNDMSSLSMSQIQPKTTGSHSVYSSSRSMAPPRLPGRSTSTDSGPFTQQRPQSNQYPSYDNPTLMASGREFQPSNHNGRQQSIVSLASSGFSEFDDKDARQSVASSYTSESYNDYRMSSRIYSEASAKVPRGMSEFSMGFSDRESDYPGSEASRRSTELGALSERGTKPGTYVI